MPVYVIAEVGVNHDGDMAWAHDLIVSAAAAGADAVKFQLFRIPGLEHLELPDEEIPRLMEACEEAGVDFICSPFSVRDVEVLASFGVTTMKIPSGQITDLPYLEAVNKYAERVIMSTGMSSHAEAQEALNVFGINTQMAVLHCTNSYPCPFEDVNLRAMRPYYDFGYSDHTLGWEVAVAAVAMGAEVIEKHLTYDKTAEGPDHASSLEPHEFAEMVTAIRNVEKALGDGVKRCMQSEMETREKSRKSIVAARDISEGEVFTPDNLTTARPGTGKSPMSLPEFFGQKASRGYKEGERL